MTLYTNAGLTISMESAISASASITSITNADPGVVTSTGHGYTDGEYVLIECQGMTEISDRMFVVYASDTNTFQLEDVDGASGIDTTNYGVFTSGTEKEITLGTTISGVQEFSPSGGDAKFLDTTTVHDLTDKQVINGANAMAYNLTMQWDPADVAQAAMKEAFLTSANKGFKIQWPAGVFAMFYGTVGFSGAPGGTSQGVTTSPAAVAMNGTPTYGQ